MEIEKNKPLASLSTFGIGGRAEYYTKVSKSEKILKAINWAKKHNVKCSVIGGGSNIVFPDKILPGLLIQIKGGEITREKGGNELAVDAGISLQKIINFANTLGLQGLETLAGIPGTLGGSIVGNAGAYGHSISEIVKNVKVWDGEKIRTLNNKECLFNYRDSIFKKEDFLILKTILQFTKCDPSKLLAKSDEIKNIRRKKYAAGIKCPGSFFKNIPVKDISKETLGKIDKSKIIENKIPAGYLLQEVGAKGMASGGIQVADFHGNFFINKGGGTQADVKSLAKTLKQKVLNKFGIKLCEEIHYF